jgi:hypothetical protein
MSTRQPRTALDSPTAKKAHPRSITRSRRWYALTVAVAVCAAIVYLGASTYIGSSPARRVAEQSPLASDSGEALTGKIILETNPDQCEQMKFDNASGRYIDGRKPCDNQIQFDEHGKPIPLGTIHRLDSISRSFFGR